MKVIQGCLLNMYFTNVKAHNFLSIGDVEMDLVKRGLLILTGENLDDPSASSNGAGKSALVESIYWCLYGDTLRNVKYVDSVVNRGSKKDCYVKVELQVKSGNLVIERYRKHSEHKNKVFVKLNGEPKHATDPRVTQRTINSLLGVDSETFSRLVFIGQGFNQRFTDMNDRSLKEFIEGMTGSILYAQAHSVAKDALTEIRKKKAGFDESRKALGINVESLKVQIAEEESRVVAEEAEQKKKVAEFQASNETNQKALKETQDLIGSIEVQKASNVAEYDKQIQDWQNHIDSLKEERQKVIAEQDEWRAQLRQEEQSALAALDASINALRHQQSSELATIEQERNALAQERDSEVAKRSADRDALVAGLEAARKPFSDAYEELRKRVDSFVPPSVDPSLNVALATAKARLEALNKRVEDAQSQVGTKCPSCGQEVTDESVRKHILESFNPDAERSDIVYGANGIEACEKALEEANFAAAKEEQSQQDARSLLTGKYNELQSLVTEHQNQVLQFDQETSRIPESYAGKLNELEVKIAELKGRHASIIEAEEAKRAPARQQFVDQETVKDGEFSVVRSDWDNKIKDAESSQNSVRTTRDQYVSDTDKVLQQHRDQVSGYERAISQNNQEISNIQARDLRASLRTLQSNLDSVQKQISDIDSSAKEVDEQESVYDYLVTAFGIGGIRSYMMDSILSHLNERLQVYCQALFDGGVSVYLSPIHEQQNKSVVEKISLHVTTPGGYYDTASGGERRKVDVALFLAFRDLSRLLSPIKVNVEAYDEILSFLDGEAASRVVQMLVSDQTVETKILITHRVDVPIIGPHQIIKAYKQLGVTSYVAA